MADFEMQDQEVFGSTKFEDVESLLDGFQEGSATSDIKKYFGCFLDGNSRFLGTDPEENWSASEFLETMRPHFESTLCAWKYTPIEGKRQISFIGIGDDQDLCTFDELLVSESFLATTRGSGSAVKRNGYWYLTQYYLSFPIPNDLAKSFCETIAYWEKGTVSVEDAEKRAQQAADALLAELGADDDIGAGAVKSKTSKKSKGKKKI